MRPYSSHTTGTAGLSLIARAVASTTAILLMLRDISFDSDTEL